jgi:hydroxymethylpyrimidine pyrophosphatase-like HAD family hydrolase
VTDANAATSGTGEGPLLVTNLYAPVTELAGLAIRELDRAQWLDAFLVAGGVSQLLADYLSPDPLALRRASSAFMGGDARAAHLVGRMVTAPGAAGLERLADRRPAAARLRRLMTLVDAGLGDLGAVVMGTLGASPATPAVAGLRHACAQIVALSGSLPRALREDVVRLPSCFHSFDQHPDDVARLMSRVAEIAPDRDMSLLVVGLRTSGTYLAPLYRAALLALGYSDVATITMRPGRHLHPDDQDAIRDTAARGGRVIICDDPPGSGVSIARVCAQVARLGAGPDAVILALALFGDADALPEVLRPYPAAILPFEEWSVHRRLEPEWVRAAAAEVAPAGLKVVAATRIAQRTPTVGRGHIGATFEITVRDEATGVESIAEWCVEGVGVGYFGTHAVAVAAPLADYLPDVFGVVDGMLFREWLPETRRVTTSSGADARALAARIAGYADARRRALPVPVDTSLRHGGQYPVWEAVSMLISRACGPIWHVGRGIAVDRAVQRLLAVSTPSVIDGRTTLSEWFIDGDPATMIKSDWHQGAAWNLGLTCCDAVYDVAGAAAASDDPQFRAALLAEYAEVSGDAIDDERWLLYQLAHLWGLPDARREGRQELRRACSRAMQEYYRGIYFADLTPADDGPLCGIDIDGVLETDVMGFPALTPVSAQALRALIAHGYRPAVVTGRSLGEVIERCRAYGLAGGVAEYGSATYIRSEDRITAIGADEDQAVLERLRTDLAARDGVELNTDYALGIRAFVRDGGGARRALPDDLLAEARHAADAPDVVAIVGDAQTDLVGADIDKGRGVRALASALGVGVPLEFAVGDTAADVSLLELAVRPYAPAHGKAALADRATITRHAYQAGFADAVGHLIGHTPGGCPVCRVPDGPPGRALLLGLLGLREAGIGRMPARLGRIAAGLADPRRRR